MSDPTYRFSLIGALVLHAILVIFLLVNFTISSRPVALGSSGFINAVVVPSQNSKAAPVVLSKPTPIQPLPQKPETIAAPELPQVPTKTAPVVIKKDHKKIAELLRKNLLSEQASELAELKKNIATQQKIITSNKQEEMLKKQLAVEQEQLAGMNAVENNGSLQAQGEIDEYNAKIIQAISSQWIIPEGVDEKAVAQILVHLAPGGVVLKVELLSSSGNDALDRSAQSAVFKATPLPVPADPKAFDRFRKIKLIVNPRGVVQS